MSNEPKEPQSDKPRQQSMGFWLAMGAAMGAALGVVFDNIAIGVAIGVAIGTAIGAAQMQKDQNK